MHLIQFGLILLVVFGANGRVLESFRPRPGVPIKVQSEKSSLENVMKFYRQQGEFPRDSIEGESVEVEVPKKQAYRLELTGDETEPYASYQYEEKPKNVTASSTPDTLTVEVDVKDGTTIYPPGTGKLEFVEDGENAGEEICSEGELKAVDCNTCVCSAGSFFCSKKKCTVNMTMPSLSNSNVPITSLMNKGGNGGMIYLEDAFMSHEAFAEKKEQMLINMNMMNKPGWNKRKMQSTTPLPDCSSGMTKQIDCNQCICAQQKWACTKRSCIALTLREKASYTDGQIMKQVDTLKENHHMDDDCMEDETKKIGCNHCVCHWNSWSCTNVSCSSVPEPTKKPMHVMPEIEEACQKEADVKSKDCNICKCRRGVWVCTMNDCHKLGINKDEDEPSFRTSSKITKITKEKDL